MKSTSNNNRFYDQLAPVYHLKVDWQSRNAKEDRLFEFLIKTLMPTSVLDIGCGDGGHAERYASSGVRYHGIDKSPVMIRAAKDTHQASGVSFSTGDMTKLPLSFTGRFDQIVMLGNTLPHLTTSSELKQAFSGISRSLSTGGQFMLQTVNPRALTSKSIHLLPPKLAEGTLFTPFYVNRGKHWEFVMPIHNLSDGVIRNISAATTLLRFWSREELDVIGKTCNLKLIRSFGDGGLGSYKPRTSANLILLFRKSDRA